MEEHENIIFLDKTPDKYWTFERKLEKLSGKEFKCVYMDTHNMQGKITNIFRYLSYFVLPLYGIVHRRKIKIIVAWQQFYGLVYAFWCRLFRLKKSCSLIVLTFIYKEKKGLVGTLYKKFINYIVTSGYIDKFVCFSEAECKHYADIFHVDENLFVSCELTVEDQIERFKNDLSDGGYYLSAGRSNRNYAFLCDLFQSMPERKLYVICDRFDSDIKVPKNVKVISDAHGDEYLRYLAKCKAVILPLKTDCVSAGQLVLLQCMMFKKVCIVTETDTMKDYAKNNVNAIFMHESVTEVAEILDKVENGYYNNIPEQARKVYEKKHSGARIAEKVSEIIED